MSDFIFASPQVSADGLGSALAGIRPGAESRVHAFAGPWGAVAATASRYFGFQPLETERHVCVVIGGPVLCFQGNDFLGGTDDQAGTRAILARWQSGRADWSEDLSGPFAILVVDKQTSRVECITDLMMFIPVYQFEDAQGLCWSTHVDALARATGQQQAVDEASLVDFILHHVVTWPFTTYRQLAQCVPATVHRWSDGHAASSTVRAGRLLAEPYWTPTEHNAHASLDAAARYLREGVQGYIDRVTAPLQQVAQFISAGEDSRVLAGMLPARLQRDAFIFLDHMNREGRLARKVAEVHGARFVADYRSSAHYLDILAEASALVGSGHQFRHAHTLGFHHRHNLAGFRAVFGGYLADSLLKGAFACKPAWQERLPFLPEYPLKGERRTAPVSHPLFSEQLLQEVTRRRREHFQRLQAIRPTSADEWFELWPATMRMAMPNLYCNRRLFPSHEVFMARESVKVAAAVPLGWKLNRRLFNKAFRPALRRSRHIFHADGRLPYYPWWVNCWLQAAAWLQEKALRRLGRRQGQQGPWVNWNQLAGTPAWAAHAEAVQPSAVPPALQPAMEALRQGNGALSVRSRVNCLQVAHQLRLAAEQQGVPPDGP